MIGGQGNAPKNLSSLRKLALQIIKEQKENLSSKNEESKPLVIKTYVSKLIA